MLLQGARIYPFPLTTRNVSQRLTVRDKLDLHAWSERIEAAGFRCVMGRDRCGIDHDFVQFHRGPDACVAWTLVRAGPRIRVWHGANGPDLGAFAGLGEAVGAALEATPGAPAKPLLAAATPCTGRRATPRTRPRADH